MRVHAGTHPGYHICSECEEAFSAIESLRKHQDSHGQTFDQREAEILAKCNPGVVPLEAPGEYTVNVLHKGSKSFNINSYEHKEQVTFVDGCELVNNRMMILAKSGFVLTESPIRKCRNSCGKQVTWKTSSILQYPSETGQPRLSVARQCNECDYSRKELKYLSGVDGVLDIDSERSLLEQIKELDAPGDSIPGYLEGKHCRSESCMILLTRENCTMTRTKNPIQRLTWYPYCNDCSNNNKKTRQEDDPHTYSLRWAATRMREGHFQCQEDALATFYTVVTTGMSFGVPVYSPSDLDQLKWDALHSSPLCQLCGRDIKVGRNLDPYEQLVIDRLTFKDGPFSRSRGALEYGHPQQVLISSCSHCNGRFLNMTVEERAAELDDVEANWKYAAKFADKVIPELEQLAAEGPPDYFLDIGDSPGDSSEDWSESEHQSYDDDQWSEEGIDCDDDISPELGLFSDTLLSQKDRNDFNRWLWSRKKRKEGIVAWDATVWKQFKTISRGRSLITGRRLENWLCIDRVCNNVPYHPLNCMYLEDGINMAKGRDPHFQDARVIGSESRIRYGHRILRAQEWDLLERTRATRHTWVPNLRKEYERRLALGLIRESLYQNIGAKRHVSHLDLDRPSAGLDRLSNPSHTTKKTRTLPSPTNNNISGSSTSLPPPTTSVAKKVVSLTHSSSSSSNIQTTSTPPASPALDNKNKQMSYEQRTTCPSVAGHQETAASYDGYEFTNPQAVSRQQHALKEEAKQTRAGSPSMSALVTTGLNIIDLDASTQTHPNYRHNTFSRSGRMTSLTVPVPVTLPVATSATPRRKSKITDYWHTNRPQEENTPETTSHHTQKPSIPTYAKEMQQLAEMGFDADGQLLQLVVECNGDIMAVFERL
ncbi:hypothetical protein BG005_010096 [Podila minutissima]|nr:hypothetical protein BG005_010096 [Podila minutissima]